MTNFGAKILNNAVSSLNAQQGVLAGISNNIANAQTPGYARRSLLLQNQNSDGATGLNIGSGVRVADVIRFVDEFTNTSLRSAVSDQNSASTKNDLLARVESLFDISGDGQSIGSTLTQFFAALNDLSANPSSIELRSNLIERGQDLVNSITTTYNTISNIQREIDERFVVEVDAINNLTAQIATTNQLIIQRESGGNLAADERDRRDYLLEQLAKKISFNTVELPDGSINVTLQGGLDIVFGSHSRNLEVTTGPSFAATTTPTALWDGVPAYIVFNYGDSTTRADIDLTADIAEGGGTLAGLIQARGVYDPTDTSPFQGDGVLPQLAARVESITRFLLTNFNREYLGPDENTGTALWNPSSADLDGNAPSVYGFFDFEYSGIKDANSNGLPDDLGATGFPLSFSNLLKLTTTDPRDVAASRDLNAAAAATSFAQGDSSNILAVAGLQSSSITHTLGNYTFTGTLDQVYVNAVSFIGNEKAKAATAASVADSNYRLAADRRDQISGVSVDEEIASLTQFQKAYEAAARMIRLSNELLDELLNSI